MPGGKDGDWSAAQPATSSAASESGYASGAAASWQFSSALAGGVAAHYPTIRNGGLNSGSCWSLVDRTLPVAASKWTLKIRLVLTGI